MALLDHDGQDQARPSQQRWPDGPIPSIDAPIWPGNDNRREQPEPVPELDCLIGVLSPKQLADAAARARQLGTGADRVLIASGAIDEVSYLQYFARHTGIAIETFADIAASDLALSRDDQIHHAARIGMVQIRCGDDLVVVIAPRHLAARTMARAVTTDPGMVTRFRIAATADFDNFLLHRSDGSLAHDAVWLLRDRSPALSAAPRPSQQQNLQRILRRIMTSFALAALLSLPPSFAIEFWSQVLALWFIAAIGLRLAAALIPQPVIPRWARLPDAELPVYTIIVALYHEARSVPQLLRALDALDYPREKLDIILAVEADDHATRAAITGFGAPPHSRVIVAPDVGPRTKPKALNIALPFARGSMIAVFDAEDQPDPGQLRDALDAFRNGEPGIACAQARLCIQNINDSLFTRMFSAEYAGHFDAVLPGLAAMRLPLPLGGTSNHFRADALRDVGGWDTWNVTEDADLGLRLARCGTRTVTFASTTQEEAPITFPRWLRQRSRWMKGWMQTLSVHMRDPHRLWRDAGWRGLVALSFVFAGPIVSALAYPFLLGSIAIGLATGPVTGLGSDGRWLLGGLLTPVHFIAISSGIVATMAIGLIGLARRGRLRDGWILLLTPIFWGCLSIATWRALWQLLHDPYRWDKTEHGLASKTISGGAVKDNAANRPLPFRESA